MFGVSTCWRSRSISDGAAAVLTGSFATLTQTAATALELARADPHATEIALIATGRLGRFAVEDWLGCRQVADRVEQLVLQNAADADTSSRREIFKASMPRMSRDELWAAVSHSLSVKMVEDAGLEEDLDHCLAYDTLAVAPWFDGEGFVDYWRRPPA